MCARLSVGKSLDEPETVDELIQAAGASVKILFAGIIARYPFGGVTWCSLMYLLGLRALGHEVFYIEDTGECVYDPVLNTRVHRSVLRHRLHPRRRSSRSGSAIAGRSSTTTARYHGQSAETVQALLRRRRPVHQPVGRLVVLARRVRAHSADARSSTRTRRSRSWRSRKAEPWYVDFFQQVRPPVHVRIEHRHAGVARFRSATSRGTRPGSRSTLDDWRTRARAASIASRR